MEAIGKMRKLTEDLAGQLQGAAKSLEDREERLKRDRWELENEKDKMAAISGGRSAADLVEINVGGKVMTTRRGTLLLARGTLLEAIFSGRWEQSLERDEEGRVFLDFSPVPFEALLSFLRALRDAKPGECLACPVVPPEYAAEYKAMVRYLDWEEFLTHKCRATCPKGALVCCQSTGGTCDRSIRFDAGVIRGGNDNHRCAVGGVRLLGEDGSLEKVAWRMTVKALPKEGWFCTGVISHNSPGDASYLDSTCLAWACSTYTYMAGRRTAGHGGWGTWVQGDVAIFQFGVSNGLQMFLRRSRQVYHMKAIAADAMKEARVYFNIVTAGTEVEISQATAEDIAEAAF